MKMKNRARACLLLPLLTLLGCLCAGRARAQSVPVTLHATDTALEQVLDQIERQTTYLFVYDQSVDVARKVSVEATDMPLKNVLQQLFRTTNIGYEVENTSIVLFRKEADKPEGPVTVTGRVVDPAGQGAVGVAVVVKGTTVGASTGLDGTFTLQVPPPASQAVLAVNYLGYEPVELAVGSRTDFQITLQESAVDVDAVVVTALGIKRSEKALSYNVQKVDGDAIIAVKDANFVNSLSGKVAGLNINASSSGVGGASKVVMRGTKGIDQSSNALYVIDGIPMYNLADEGGTEFSSAGATEAIADLNPEDVESISVLTGAAAAALYGSQASNGAIVITTKRGEAGHTSVTVSSNTELMTPFVMPQFQNRYGTSNLDASWGPRLNASNSYGYDPAKDYFQAGVVGTETMAFSTGTDRNQTYVSASAVNSRGIIPNNGYDRYNFTFRNTTSFIHDRMKLDIGGSYIRQKDLNMTNQGIYSNPLVSAYLFPRGNDWEAIKMYERYDPARKIYTQYWPQGWGTLRSQNPYWINYRNLRANDKNRYMLNAGLTYDILDWLSVSGRIRIDNAETEYTEKLYASTEPTIAEGSENGYYGTSTIKDKQLYGDVLLNINKTFGEDWSLQANVGAAISDTRKSASQMRGPIRADGLPNVFNVFQLDNATTHRQQEGWREQYQSVFASAEIGYKGTYYLTLTGRNDWPSQLAGPHSVSASFFYPSVGGSVVLSQLVPRMPENLSYVKIRGSWASVGLPFARFLAYPTYEWDASQNVWKPQSAYPMYELKPERTNSWEVGLTMRFLKHFSLDVSYYDTKTFNQTFDPQISASSGYSKFYVQTGSVRNRGVELALGYKNTWKKVTWASNFTLSSNRNEILELVDNYKHPITGELITKERLDVGGLSQARFLLKKGGSLGDLYSTADLKRDSNGHIYVDEAGDIGVEYKVSDIKLGSVFPKANLAWRNDFQIGGFNLGFMISARLGGIVYSATQAYLDAFGVSEASAAARDRGDVIINGMDRISAEKWYGTIGGNGGLPQYYTYSATNVRLQEASIGYTIPKKKLGDVVEITLSLVGRNLWMIYCKAPFDPEAVATTGNYYQGIDYFMMPSLRSVGFNLRLKF
ncbi:SusC/RagA family TonB-linked outer membrane protein [uncultured Alistipes sp.]|uniref:SusC/RagA family TonB-linked outer membrane protein n=1 Tax=uncultured Alistipes sp. TaxID=538949 RepID=UPI0025AF9BBA|nr:SusC/RagA family TonB-linked outer membrane protein [uncultured Alistipes sp.]